MSLWSHFLSQFLSLFDHLFVWRSRAGLVDQVGFAKLIIEFDFQNPYQAFCQLHQKLSRWLACSWLRRSPKNQAFVRCAKKHISTFTKHILLRLFWCTSINTSNFQTWKHRAKLKLEFKVFSSFTAFFVTCGHKKNTALKMAFLHFLSLRFCYRAMHGKRKAKMHFKSFFKQRRATDERNFWAKKSVFLFFNKKRQKWTF